MESHQDLQAEAETPKQLVLPGQAGAVKPGQTHSSLGCGLLSTSGSQVGWVANWLHVTWGPDLR